MGGLTRATAGCYDAALAYGTPFISGKDSLNNEYRTADGERIAIPGTLLISAMAYHHDIRHAQTSDFKQAGNLIFVVGQTTAAMAGAHATQVAGLIPGAEWQLPRVDLAQAPAVLAAVHQAISSGVVASCHDLSEGGLAVAVAEMSLAGQLGAQVDLATLPASCTDPVVRLFSESPTRFVVEIAPDQVDGFTRIMADLPHAQIGVVSASPTLTFTHHQTLVAELSLADITAAFLTSTL
jgi:phosphoribosylformylglycinamidine synthase